jgi:hypothetical protein
VTADRQASKNANADLHVIAAKIVEAASVLVPALNQPDLEANPALIASIERITRLVISLGLDTTNDLFMQIT